MKFGFMFAACIVVLPLPTVLLPPSAAEAQATSPSDTRNHAAAPGTYRPLPLGVFRGSLPPGKTDPALIEAGQNAQDAIVQGEALLKSGHVKDAVSAFQNALSYAPTDGLAYRRLAEAYAAAGKLREASRAFHKFLVEGFGPGNGNGGVGDTADEWAEYALVLVKTGQTADAVQAYNHAASLLDYEGGDVQNGKQTVKVLLPELVAERTLPEQVQYTPEHLQALADTALAHEEMSFGSNKEAVTHMREAVKLYPDSPVTNYYLGEALLVKDSAGAKAAYQKAVELGDDKTVAAAKERLSVIR